MLHAKELSNFSITITIYNKVYRVPGAKTAGWYKDSNGWPVSGHLPGGMKATSAGSGAGGCQVVA